MKTIHQAGVIALLVAFGVLGYNVAEAKPGPKHPACNAPRKECPCQALAELADISVAKTSNGASIVFVAKDIGKLADLQAVVAKMGEHLKTQHCAMAGGVEPQPEQHPHDHGAAHAR